MSGFILTPSTPLAQLQGANRRARDLVMGWDDEQLTTQYHPDLSPMGWHIGHMAVVEAYWVCEIVGRSPLPDDVKRLYFPETSPKDDRGTRLPSSGELFSFSDQLQADVQRRARSLSVHDHVLLCDDYLWHFLNQHHWQHVEIMQQVRHQRAIREHTPRHVSPGTQACPPRLPAVSVPGSRLTVGSADARAFDNERQPHEPDLTAFLVSAHPATNAEYLSFIHAGGYETSTYWDPEGWAWRLGKEIQAPLHWRRTRNGAFYAIDPGGPAPLAEDLPVSGLSYYEATAFARYAGCRLPHEHEWERAARLGLLEETGQVWEWCANTLYAYPDFQPFPYERYSLPWFDGRHHVLRGGSVHTDTSLRRPSFRNFYTADKRHVFAGVRLARD
ncbi:MAG: SUMF1/EgtB/PvdO family nonheme iron enzyme [Acidiferrobacteraceae bacterium]